MAITLSVFCLAIVTVSVLGGMLPLATVLNHTRLQVYLSFAAGRCSGRPFSYATRGRAGWVGVNHSLGGGRSAGAFFWNDSSRFTSTNLTTTRKRPQRHDPREFAPPTIASRQRLWNRWIASVDKSHAYIKLECLTMGLDCVRAGRALPGRRGALASRRGRFRGTEPSGRGRPGSVCRHPRP